MGWEHSHPLARATRSLSPRSSLWLNYLRAVNSRASFWAHIWHPDASFLQGCCGPQCTLLAWATSLSEFTLALPAACGGSRGWWGGRAGLGGTGVLLAVFIPLCLADCVALQAGCRWPQGPGCGWKASEGPSVKRKIGRGPHMAPTVVSQSSNTLAAQVSPAACGTPTPCTRPSVFREGSAGPGRCRLCRSLLRACRDEARRSPGTWRQALAPGGLQAELSSTVVLKSAASWCRRREAAISGLSSHIPCSCEQAPRCLWEGPCWHSESVDIIWPRSPQG